MEYAILKEDVGSLERGYFFKVDIQASTEAGWTVVRDELEPSSTPFGFITSVPTNLLVPLTEPQYRSLTALMDVTDTDANREIMRIQRDLQEYYINKRR